MTNHPAPTRPELLAAAAFWMFAARSDAIMDPADIVAGSHLLTERIGDFPRVLRAT
jgi:hypothetical protein